MNIPGSRSPVRHFGYDLPISDEIVEYYNSVPRDGDVALAVALAGDPDNANVIEIGCGIGREAAVVTTFTTNYLGIEESPDLINLCRKRAPLGEYKLANPVEFDYGIQKYDLALAFATLRYFTKDEVSVILRKVYTALKPGGVVYLSLNYGDSYKELLRDDRFGKRKVVLYNPEIIHKLAGPGYKKIHESTSLILGVKWFEIALKREV